MSLSKNAPLWRLVTTMHSGEKIILDEVRPVQANTASEARAALKKKLNAAGWKARRLPVGYSVERMPT